MYNYPVFICVYLMLLSLSCVVHWFSFVCLNFIASTCDLCSHRAKPDRLLFFLYILYNNDCIWVEWYSLKMPPITSSLPRITPCSGQAFFRGW